MVISYSEQRRAQEPQATRNLPINEWAAAIVLPKIKLTKIDFYEFESLLHFCEKSGESAPLAEQSLENVLLIEFYNRSLPRAADWAITPKRKKSIVLPFSVAGAIYLQTQEATYIDYRLQAILAQIDFQFINLI